MNQVGFSPQLFDPQTAPAWQVEALARHDMEIRAERYPTDPPVPLEDCLRNIRLPDTATHKSLRWAYFDGGCAAASAVLDWTVSAGRQNFAFGDISVLPRWRRRGIGTALLGLIGAAARGIRRDTLFLESTDRVPAGAAFLAFAGAAPGLENHVYQLDLRQLDAALMRAWIERGKEQAQGLDFIFWEGLPPEDLLDPFCEMITYIQREEPRGTLDISDSRVTPERLRDRQAAIAALGHRRWVLAAVLAAPLAAVEKSGTPGARRIVGYTELIVNPSEPSIIDQRGTCVFTEYRGRGIGRRLKAEMILKTLAELPEARFVRTQTADSNAAMLKINAEMGYTPFESVTDWQLKVRGWKPVVC